MPIAPNNRKSQKQRQFVVTHILALELAQFYELLELRCKEA